jgi:ribonuclease BN (tRNA processing enzyme)
MSKNLVYYFNVADFLEVENASNGDWVQVTCLHLDHTLGIDALVVKTYVGPILYSGTNLLYEGPLTGKLLNIEDVNDLKSLRKVRKNSKFAYSNE